MTESGIRKQGPEIIRVETSEVSCDGMGVGGESGHPLVYLAMGLAMGEERHVTCPYCRRQFVLVERP